MRVQSRFLFSAPILRAKKGLDAIELRRELLQRERLQPPEEALPQVRVTSAVELCRGL
jgi:hypothetical protein